MNLDKNMIDDEQKPQGKSVKPNRRRKRSDFERDVREKMLTAYQPLTRDRELVEAINDLLDSYEDYETQRSASEGKMVGRLNEGRALVVFGETGVGKTRATKRAISQIGMNDPEEGFITITVDAPSPCTLRQLGIEILRKLGYPIVRNLQENEVWRLVRQHLELRKVRFVFIDEMQHLNQLHGEHEILKVCDTMKGLMQNDKWPVWLIICGLSSLAEIFECDGQLRRRSSFIHFETLDKRSGSKTIGLLLDNYQTKTGLKVSSHDKFELTARLIHAAEGRFGIVVETIQDAFLVAARENRKDVLIGDFERAYAKRTGCGSDQNVFAADLDWETVDVRRLMDTDDHQDTPRSTRRSRRESREDNIWRSKV